MPVRIKGELKISPSLENFIQNHKHLASDGIERGMEYLGQGITKRVKETIQTLGLIRSGRLYKSIDYEVTAANKKWKTTVGSNMYYAHMLEGGARPSPFTVKPDEKKALFWPGAEHPVKKVNHPGVRIRAYNFLGGTINDMERAGTIEELFAQGVKEAIDDLIRRGF